MNNYKQLLLALIPMMLIACAKYEVPEKPTRTLEEKVFIERTSNGKDLLVKAETPFSLFYMGGKGELGKKVELNEDGSIPSPANSRPIFWVVSGNDTFRLRERHVPVKGSPNIREVGGVFTKDGYQLKWGKVYRSGNTSGVTEADFDLLKTMAIRTIIDFRAPFEITEDPDKWPGLDQINSIHNQIGVGDSTKDRMDWLKEMKKDDFDPNQMLIEGNRNFVLENTGPYSNFMKLFLEEENYPILYHCSAGKDRAGFGTLSLLMALGVDSATAVQDYLMSNYYRFDSTEDQLKKAATFLGVPPEKLRPIMNVKPEFIHAAFEAVTEKYGDFDTYLCEGLGICKTEREKLKGMLLYDYPADTSLLDSLHL
ncbi:MAG: tyrosine-protein phosphatase [Bacteroidota bacterium]